MIAVGVARPKAHGQDMTRTHIPIESENSKPLPRMSQTIVDRRAMAMTIGTNTPLTLSASLAIGAFELVASSTSLTICESVVSSPTLRAFILIYPDFSVVAPVTRSPTLFSAGTLSPVIADSSAKQLPATTSPSTGILSPLLTMRISPTATSSAGTVNSFSSLMTVAVLGERSMSFSIAPEVLPLALASKNFPRVISVSITPADSK